MNKHEVSIAKIQATGDRFAHVIGLVRTGLVGGIILGSIYLIMSGLQGLVGASEGQLKAMAGLVDKFHISQMVHYTADAVLVAGFLLQRTNAKRAIREKAKFQRIAENSDSRTSSGLTPTGDTPND